MTIFLLFFLFTAQLSAIDTYPQFNSVTLPAEYGNVLDLHQTSDKNIIVAYFNEETRVFSLIKIDTTGTIITTMRFGIARQYDRIYITFTDDFAILIGSDPTGNFSSILSRFSYANLVIDATFGTDGILTAHAPVDVNTAKSTTCITSCVQNGSYYYLTGTTHITNTNRTETTKLALLRYNLNGTPDNTFNNETNIETYNLIAHEASGEPTNLLILSSSIIYRTTQRIMTIILNAPSTISTLITFGVYQSQNTTLIPRNSTSFFTAIPTPDGDQGYFLSLQAYSTLLSRITSVGSTIIADSGVYNPDIRFVSNTFYYATTYSINDTESLTAYKLPFNGTSLTDTTKILYHSKSYPTSLAFLATDDTTQHYFLATNQTIRKIAQRAESIGEAIRALEQPLAFLS